MSALRPVVVVAFLWIGASSLQFSEHIPDNLHACVGSNVTFPWTFLQASGHIITSVNWIVYGRSREMIAILSHNAFAPLPAFFQRVEHGSDGTLTIRHVTTQDSGNYTIEINGRDPSASAFTTRDTIHLQVAEYLMTTDHQLHVTQSPRAMYNDVTQEWSLQLSCGRFTYVGRPPFNVEWVSPSGGHYNSSSYGDGQYHWLVPNPVEEGSYTCLIPTRYVHVLCLPPGTSQGPGATLAVDNLKVRVMLMETEQRSLRKKVTKLQVEKARSARHIHNLQVAAFMRDTTRQQVSFHAKMTTDQHLDNNITLVLSTVLSNHGNAYNGTTGIFTAPYNATYFFIACTGSYSRAYDAFMLMEVDGAVVGVAFAHRIHPRNEMATCHAVVTLTRGQRVRLRSAGVTYFHREDTYFSGFLVYGQAAQS